MSGLFWRGLYSEGLIFGGKFVFQNRLGWPYSWKEIYRFCLALHCNFPSTSSRSGGGGGAYIWRGHLMEGFLRYRIWRDLYMEGLIFGILRYSRKNASNSRISTQTRKRCGTITTWPGLLEAWLVLTSVKYHGNLYNLIPLNQRLALTRLRATGP